MMGEFKIFSFALYIVWYVYSSTGMANIQLLGLDLNFLLSVLQLSFNYFDFRHQPLATWSADGLLWFSLNFLIWTTFFLILPLWVTQCNSKRLKFLQQINYQFLHLLSQFPVLRNLKRLDQSLFNWLVEWNWTGGSGSDRKKSEQKEITDSRSASNRENLFPLRKHSYTFEAQCCTWLWTRTFGL